MNRLYIGYAFLFLGAVFLQVLIVPYLEILHWKPDLILIVLVMFSMHVNQNAATTAGFLSGLAGDLVSAHMLGLGALSKSITGYLSAGLVKYFREQSQFILTLLIAGLVHDLIYFFIDTLGKAFSWRLILFVYILPNLFYTVLVGALVYYVIGGWLKPRI